MEVGQYGEGMGGEKGFAVDVEFLSDGGDLPFASPAPKKLHSR
jgi:hypothetical protein